MCSFGKDEYGLQTGNVKISELHDFKGHPFKVELDIQLFELMRSIEDKGVLVFVSVQVLRKKRIMQQCQFTLGKNFLLKKGLKKTAGA